MNAFFDSGAGSPVFDAGAGDPLGFSGFSSTPLLSVGAGDPAMLYDAPLFWYVGFRAYPPGSSEFSGLRYPDADKVSWVGGHMVFVVGFPFNFDNVPYRVDLLDEFDQPHPLTEPGCYSAVQGQGSEIYPEPDNTTLVFSTPPLPPAVYRIRITDSLNQSVILANTIESILDLDCLETTSIRSGLDPNVYPGAHPDKDYDFPPDS